MTSLMRDLTWTQRAEAYDRLAERHEQAGNTRDAEFARVNAMTMRMMAVEDGEVVPEGVSRG